MAEELGSASTDYEYGLVGLGELDVDVFPEIVHLEALFIVGQDRAHHILISVFFLAQQLANIVRTFAVQHITEDASRFVRESIVDKNQIDLAVLNPDACHGTGGLPLVEQKDKARFLLRFDSGNFLIDQRIERFTFRIAEFDPEQRDAVSGNRSGVIDSGNLLIVQRI